jgi:hypothetical protein
MTPLRNNGLYYYHSLILKLNSPNQEKSDSVIKNVIIIAVDDPYWQNDVLLDISEWVRIGKYPDGPMYDAEECDLLKFYFTMCW